MLNENLQKRRQLSYKLNKWDDINLEYEINNNDIPRQVIDFFNSESSLIYPAKSYFVAIVYSACLEKYFQIPFFYALDSFDLLPDDKYFIQYSKSKEIYDNILDVIKKENIFNYQKSIQKTVNYFKKEFLIDQNIFLKK